jgi:hypothetical protein
MDGTWEAIESHVRLNHWANAEREPQLPLVPSLNRLLATAQGDRILVLNGDDRVLAQSTAEVLRDAPSAEIACGNVRVLSPTGIPLGVRGCDVSALGRYMSVNHPALFVPKSVYETVGDFDNRCRFSFDYEWTWRAWRAGIPFRCYSVILADARLGGLSSLKAREAAAEILRFKIRNGALLSGVASYGAFLAKTTVEELLPHSAVRILRRWKRTLFGTVEHYGPPSGPSS